jgi:hypothetical protein
MKQPELYHRIKDDEAPVWFLVLMYTLAAGIIMGSIMLFWIVTP